MTRQTDRSLTEEVARDARATAWPDWLPRVLYLAMAAFFVAFVPLLVYRFFDPDEFQHAHAAWSISKGLVLYKDLFEHHTPWYYALLRPLFRWFPPAASFDDARRFLIVARAVSVLLAVGAVALLTRVGRIWESRRVGLLAAALMVTQPFFIKKTIEIRPDLLALLFFLTALGALLRGVSPRAAVNGRRAVWFALAGLAQGSAVMCTQKMLFVLPGVLAGLGLWVLAEERLSRTAHVLLFLVAVALPGVATWQVFRWLHAGDYFILNNFLLNARWARIPAEQLIRFVGTSAPVLALAIYGAVRALPGLMRADRRDPGEALLLCLVVWLFVAIEFIPAAQMQYYLMPLPIVCLFAARALDDLACRLGRRVWAWALAALSVLPLVNLGMDLSMTNGKQLARLRQVAETTRPTDLVMDGWQGLGVFRPNAFYYYFINDEILLMIPPARFSAFMDDMEAGRLRPALIVLDRRLVALGPRFRAFVNAHYGSRDGLLYYWAG